MRLALDIGGTSIKGAIVTDSGEILRDYNFPTDANADSVQFARILMKNLKDFLSNGKENITFAGAGMAGFVDGVSGVVLSSPNLPNIKKFRLADVLSAGLGVDARIENGATSAAWGEFLFGGFDGKNLLVVTLGTGIGGGLILDGRLHRGSRGFAGEIGQMVLNPEGPENPGGGAGGLEHYVGRRAVEEFYSKESGNPEKISPLEIFMRAEKGDSAAVKTWDEYGKNLGIVFASCANLLDLDVIILTGGIASASTMFTKSLETSLKKYLITPLKDIVSVKISKLKGNAGLIGAAFLDKAN